MHRPGTPQRAPDFLYKHGVGQQIGSYPPPVLKPVRSVLLDLRAGIIDVLRIWPIDVFKMRRLFKNSVAADCRLQSFFHLPGQHKSQCQNHDEFCGVPPACPRFFVLFIHPCRLPLFYTPVNSLRCFYRSLYFTGTVIQHLIGRQFTTAGKMSRSSRASHASS